MTGLVSQMDDSDQITEEVDFIRPLEESNQGMDRRECTMI